MDVVAIINGLGNQMSGYAFYLAKKKVDTSTEYVCYDTGHNGIELETLFDICAKNTTLKKRFCKFLMSFMYRRTRVLKPVRKFLTSCGIKLLEETSDQLFHPEYLNMQGGIRLFYGAWTCENYFSSIKHEIEDIYKFPQFTNPQNDEIAELAKLPDSVAIHVRRGDYFDEAIYNIFGKEATSEYYVNAIKKMKLQIGHPHFFVFSNDEDWSRNFFGNDSATYIDWNTGNDSWQDMALMSKFHHIIIPNSSFSWWAAWLHGDSKYVICPECFRDENKNNDFYPKAWHKVSNKNIG